MTLFQFDYDLTFTVFFMNADKTIYGRYGTRSSREEAEKNMTTAGLAASMSEVLKLHQQYPANKNLLAGKQAVPTKFKSPDDYPTLRGKFKKSLDYSGAVTKSCMHCHQVRDAEQQIYRTAGKPFPERLLYPNPLPDVVGLSFDPRSRSTISKVDDNSAALEAGFKKGDMLMSLNGQPIVSLSDVQWVLHNADRSDELAATVTRNGKSMELSLTLKDGWRNKADIGWRVSTWPIRRMVTGGLILEATSSGQRRRAGVQSDQLALRIKRVGQYGAHAAAKRAGFKEGDVIVSYNGNRTNMSPNQLLTYAIQNTKPRQRIDVEVFRSGKRIKLKMPMQE